MPRTHSDRAYEEELRHLREKLLLMGAKVEEMLAASMRALTTRDTELAKQTVLMDRQVNRLEMEIDDDCLKLLARRQPVGSDLRFITTTLKAVTDLERVGDLGVNICDRVEELNREPALKPYVQIVAMADGAQLMLREALDAFVLHDVERAIAVVERDAAIDAFYKSVFRDLLTYMMEDPRTIFRATRVQSIAKYVERVADHAVNLAELVVFMVRGKDIRHSGRIAPGAAQLPAQESKRNLFERAPESTKPKRSP
jgi:phosphate transport system protein